MRRKRKDGDAGRGQCLSNDMMSSITIDQAISERLTVQSLINMAESMCEVDPGVHHCQC